MASKSPTGVGVDSSGGAVIDPTKNVEDLVRANSEAAKDMRTADQRFLDAQLLAQEKLQTFARDAEARISILSQTFESKFQNASRDAEVKRLDELSRAETRRLDEVTQAETRRIDQLAQNRQEFQNTIRDMLAESVRTTSTLVSTQLVQIQATFDTRVSKLEAFQFTLLGKASAADPQTEATMMRLSNSIASLTQTTTDAMNKSANATAESITKLTTALSTMQSGESRVGGNLMGREQGNARMLAIIGTVGGVAAVLIAGVVMFTTLNNKPQVVYLPAPAVQGHP